MDAPFPAEPQPFAPGTIIAGKYRIERELGAGGVGVVALATHVELGQRVAIKYLRNGRGANGQSVERFKREAKLAASLRSEHVVKVYDVGSLDDGTPYMVMECLEGEDLSGALKRGALAIEQAVQWTLEACQALEEAHTLGIVHRDLKPANFFLAKRSGGSPIVKILDFGISKLIESSAIGGIPVMTRQNEIFGTPYYMSPEQLVSSANVDARSDIWAMGVCLYELLTGRLPFENDDLRQLVADVLSSTPTPIRDHRGDIPIELAQIVHACLSYDPEQRPRTVASLAHRLAPFASGRYVRQLALAETSPESSGLHDLGWVQRPTPSSSLPLPVPTPRSSFATLTAVGAMSVVLGAGLAVTFALSRTPASPAQSFVGAEPHAIVVTLPSAAPLTEAPARLVDIVETVPSNVPDAAAPTKHARPARIGSSTDEFGGRQ